MRNRYAGATRGFLGLVLLPLVVAACARNTAEAPFADPAPGEIARSVSGASTVLDVSVEALATATEAVFVEMGIALEGREHEEEGIELDGRDGAWEVDVDIDRDHNDPLAELSVSVHQGNIDFNQSRSVEILRAIMARVE